MKLKTYSKKKSTQNISPLQRTSPLQRKSYTKQRQLFNDLKRRLDTKDDSIDLSFKIRLSVHDIGRISLSVDDTFCYDTKRASMGEVGSVIMRLKNGKNTNLEGNLKSDMKVIENFESDSKINNGLLELKINNGLQNNLNTELQNIINKNSKINNEYSKIDKDSKINNELQNKEKNTNETAKRKLNKLLKNSTDRKIRKKFVTNIENISTFCSDSVAYEQTDYDDLNNCSNNNDLNDCSNNCSIIENLNNSLNIENNTSSGSNIIKAAKETQLNVQKRRKDTNSSFLESLFSSDTVHTPPDLLYKNNYKIEENLHNKNNCKIEEIKEAKSVKKYTEGNNYKSDNSRKNNNTDNLRQNYHKINDLRKNNHKTDNLRQNNYKTDNLRKTDDSRKNNNKIEEYKISNERIPPTNTDSSFEILKMDDDYYYDYESDINYFDFFSNDVKEESRCKGGVKESNGDICTNAMDDICMKGDENLVKSTNYSVSTKYDDTIKYDTIKDDTIKDDTIKKDDKKDKEGIGNLFGDVSKYNYTNLRKDLKHNIYSIYDSILESTCIENNLNRKSKIRSIDQSKNSKYLTKKIGSIDKLKKKIGSLDQSKNSKYLVNSSDDTSVDKSISKYL